ncbi:GDP-mannose 4,6-dehydratase [Acidiferrobacter thiooxydans]|uniref:GDP-mannose 4,6-dehydratase n=1 Tax=Acidiferrobacter thiooxydans TaxID=163359 RepID=A0A368HM98_9GAMM|nr:GDP-mannose 4,6-dehydratase [Acidiferrobacter thiooxydans]RCN59267.1 GDP-mannose 4,6-dehydratase [Acidiferrobacter thiooxydans]
MTQKRALICGVTGQDGAYLAQLLLGKGYQVWGTSRKGHTARIANLATLGIADQVQIESMVLVDPQSIRDVVERVQPDEIYHLAGQSSVGLSFQEPRETWEGIATGTVNLLEAVRLSDRPIRFYHAGSSECFGDTQGECADETTPFRPKSPYAVAKAAATWSVATYREAYGLYACTGILFNHESPLRPDRFVTRKIVAAACRIAAGSDEKLHLGNVSIQRDWGWAPEYVESMYRMLQQENPDDYVIATGHTISLEQFVGITFTNVDRQWREHVVIDNDLLRPTEVAVGCANPAKAARVLGWRATSGVKDVIAKLITAERERDWGDSR